MLIVAFFYGDDKFTHIINTSKLKPELKEEIEQRMLTHPNYSYEGYEYFSDIQEGIFKPQEYPISIHGMITIYI